MRTRVLDTWHRLTGVSVPDSLASALTEALLLRAALDDHHPWFLHPARTALVLLDDCAEVDPAVLACAVATDSLVPAWHGAAAAAVPVPARDGDQLLEALVAAPRRVRLVACTERLDHARHLHLIEYQDPAAFRAQIAEVYLPVAERTDARLARRTRRWLEARERRRR